MFVQDKLSNVPGGSPWSLYCICDGHNGVAAALYVRDRLWATLAPLLPRFRMRDDCPEGVEHFALRVRMALIKTFVRIGRRVKRDVSGTSLTVALLCGKLLTVANVGDSEAVLDTGTGLFLATVSHRIQDNTNERDRLSDAGVCLAPLSTCLSRPASPGSKGFGPLRCWPGGLIVSRSLGNGAAPSPVFSCPHVSQVIVPTSGARLIMGSAGLWGMVHWEEGALITRRTALKEAAAKIISEALSQSNWSMSEDASTLVVDMLPPRPGGFPKIVKQKLRREQRRKGRGCCLGLGARICDSLWRWGGSQLDADCDKLEIIAKVDGWELVKRTLEVCPNDSCSSLMELGQVFSSDYWISSPPVWVSGMRLSGRRSAGCSLEQRESHDKKSSFERRISYDQIACRACRLSQSQRQSNERRSFCQNAQSLDSKTSFRSSCPADPRNYTELFEPPQNRHSAGRSSLERRIYIDHVRSSERRLSQEGVECEEQEPEARESSFVFRPSFEQTPLRQQASRTQRSDCDPTFSIDRWQSLKPRVPVLYDEHQSKQAAFGKRSLDRVVPFTRNPTWRGADSSKQGQWEENQSPHQGRQGSSHAILIIQKMPRTAWGINENRHENRISVDDRQY